MKRKILTLALAVLTVGLLGSCSKINERIDSLEKRIDGIENEKIASIDSQIASINSSIADLGTIRGDISDLKETAEDLGIDIFNLEEADRSLTDRIRNLEDYLDDVLPNYAEKDWVIATFSTLYQYEATCDTIAKIDARIGKLDERLSKEIKACADSMKKWINVQFEAYYTAAEMDAALEYMQAEIDSAKVSGKVTDATVDSLANELTKTKAAVDSAKVLLTREYKAAIDTAIKTSEGKLTKALTDAIAKVNSDITALTTRVANLEISVATLKGSISALESMIQSVTIVPAYSDGSVDVKKDTLCMDCIISPASAVGSLTKDNFTILVNNVLMSNSVDFKTISITRNRWFSKDASKGTVSFKVPIRDYIPVSPDSSLTVAVNVRNGISDYTTYFVPVSIPVSVNLDKHSIFVQSPDSDKDTTLTATVRHARDRNVTWESNNTDIATVDEYGKVTIKANKLGKASIFVKTVEGNAGDTCIVNVLQKGALPGVFTVNGSGAKIRFSQGNLWYGKVGGATQATWNFEANQYDFKSRWDENHVSHFFWSRKSEEVYRSVYDDDGGLGSDIIFTNSANDNPNWTFTVNGVKGAYRTLSKEEWIHLFERRSASRVNGTVNARYAKARVNGKAGVILLPGIYRHPSEVAELTNINKQRVNYDGNKYDLDSWTKMESAGAVFLPAAGSRQGKELRFGGAAGNYWSSDINRKESVTYESYPNSVFFSGNDLNPDAFSFRSSGYSIRLVTQ